MLACGCVYACCTATQGLIAVVRVVVLVVIIHLILCLYAYDNVCSPISVSNSLTTMALFVTFTLPALCVGNLRQFSALQELGYSAFGLIAVPVVTSSLTPFLFVIYKSIWYSEKKWNADELIGLLVLDLFLLSPATLVATSFLL